MLALQPWLREESEHKLLRKKKESETNSCPVFLQIRKNMNIV